MTDRLPVLLAGWSAVFATNRTGGFSVSKKGCYSTGVNINVRSAEGTTPELCGGSGGDRRNPLCALVIAVCFDHPSDKDSDKPVACFSWATPNSKACVFDFCRDNFSPKASAQSV